MYVWGGKGSVDHQGACGGIAQQEMIQGGAREQACPYLCWCVEQVGEAGWRTVS